METVIFRTGEGVGVKIVKMALGVDLLLFLVLIGPLQGQVDPALTIYDMQGMPFTAQDNSTVFIASPGAYFQMEITGAVMAPFGLFMSLFTTPFPTNIVPPPLFIMPPIFPIIAGPGKVLDPSGSFSFTGIVPPDFLSLGYDVDLYFQGFVQDPVNGLQLTNGIRMVIISPLYKADLAVAYGSNLKAIEEFGRILDADAGDNKSPQGGGPGLENGEPVVPDPEIKKSIYAFTDDVPPPPGSPVPSTSIFLNGRFPLVPGDAGIDQRFLTYPKVGSHLHILTRDRICRDNENQNLQHIIVPVFESGGKKTHDLNVYQFRDVDTGEYGFMVLDVLNNDFYELTGTRLISNNSQTSESPWGAHVAVSPDGKFMAAVNKDRTGDYVGVVESL